MVRFPRAAVAPLAAVLLVIALTACGSSGSSGGNEPTKGLGPNPTGPNPGPNTTTFDPGPNPTTGGPVTVDGTLRLTPQCVTLRRSNGALALHFRGYTNRNGTLIDDTHTPVARNGDHIAVSGQPGTKKNACGTAFTVANLVTVLPN